MDNDYLILDFEATCDEPKDKLDIKKQEIIEFPVVPLDDSKPIFHQYVKPILTPQLPQFCTQLTGISQDTVNNSKEFHDVYKDFLLYIKQFNNPVFVTCGDWDLKICLPRQLKNSNIYPESGNPIIREYKTNPKTGEKNIVTLPKINYEPFRYINIKKEFQKFYKLDYQLGMKGMLNHLKLDLKGHHHSGIDDCKNIKRIIQKMINDGFIF